MNYKNIEYNMKFIENIYPEYIGKYALLYHKFKDGFGVFKIIRIYKFTSRGSSILIDRENDIEEDFRVDFLIDGKTGSVSIPYSMRDDLLQLIQMTAADTFEEAVEMAILYSEIKDV